MPNPRYRRGQAAEHRARSALEGRGYTVVRAAGSKGPVDLVGIRPDGVLLVQVKSGSARASAAELAALALLPRPPGAAVELWTWQGRAGWQVRHIPTPAEMAAKAEEKAKGV